jgi:hypothetical protein
LKPIGSDWESLNKEGKVFQFSAQLNKRCEHNNVTGMANVPPMIPKNF